MVRRSKQNGLLLQGDALFPVSKNLLHHIFHLTRLVFDRYEPWLLRRRAVREKVLREAFGCALNDGVTSVENGLGRAVVLFEGEHLGATFELIWKIENIADVGGTEAIDRLCVVADNSKPASARP